MGVDRNAGRGEGGGSRWRETRRRKSEDDLRVDAGARDAQRLGRASASCCAGVGTPTYSSRPNMLRAFATALTVALRRMKSPTSSGVALGATCRKSAAAPLT